MVCMIALLNEGLIVVCPGAATCAVVLGSSVGFDGVRLHGAYLPY